MTTVETERVSAPDIERRDAREERERRAGVLEAAALEIEVRGWNQGRYRGDSGEVCILAAMTLGGAERFTPCDEEFGIPNHAAAWNDAPERTAADVTFLLRWRAEEIRDGR